MNDWPWKNWQKFHRSTMVSLCKWIIISKGRMSEVKQMKQNLQRIQEKYLISDWYASHNTQTYIPCWRWELLMYINFNILLELGLRSVWKFRFLDFMGDYFNSIWWKGEFAWVYIEKKTLYQEEKNKNSFYFLWILPEKCGIILATKHVWSLRLSSMFHVHNIFPDSPVSIGAEYLTLSSCKSA